MAPQKKQFKKSWDLSTMVVTLTHTAGRSESFDFNSLPADMQRMCSLNGLTQKLADKAAKEVGTPASEKWEGIMAAWEALLQNEWTMRSEGQGSMLLRALCEAYPTRDKGELKATLDGWSNAERNAVSRSSRIKPILDRMQSERASDIDADALLSELE